MKKIIASFMMIAPTMITAQTAVDAYSLSQTELKGTARYMSMAGAYGALGGDLSSIGQNPGGIGVYRSSDVGITLSLDLQSTQANGNDAIGKTNQTKFNCNNFGYVGTFKLDSETMPYFNFGFSYNRPVSYNRRYKGHISNLNGSLSNYIANKTNSYGYTDYDLAFEYDKHNNVVYDPYIDSNAPWLSIMAYNSFIMNPTSINVDGDGTNFVGLMNANTYGFGEFEVIEEGGVNEFAVNLGGNVSNMLFWGAAFGVSSLDMSKYTYYGESLTDATVMGNDKGVLDKNGFASFGLENWVSTKGDGMNLKFGVIVKPINEIRIGAAFHTPTYWSLNDQAYSTISYETSNLQGNYVLEGLEEANAGYVDEVNYRILTPWKFNVCLATVLGGRAIVSAEYERVAYNDMSIEYEDGYGDYYEVPEVSESIKDYYKAMDIYRIGAEYRLSSALSLRLGYSYQGSPVNKEALNGRYNVITAGTVTSYVFDKSTQYVTGGLGYRNGGFYTDLAYVHKTRESEYHSYAETQPITIKDKNSQVVWSIGYRF